MQQSETLISEPFLVLALYNCKSMYYAKYEYSLLRGVNIEVCLKGGLKG